MPLTRRLIPAILTGMLLLLAACRPDPVRRQLLAADAIIETAPDSALAILSRISPARLAASPEANRPLHALLLTQAQTKCGITITSDSLISIALRAYGSEGSDPDLRKRAHFYAADIAYNSGDLRRSMRHALTARDISIRLSDPYWTAKSAEVIADIFNASYNNPQAELYSREAADNYLRAGRIRNHRYALCDLATELTNQGKYPLALNLFDSIVNAESQEIVPDSALIQYAIEASLPAMYHSGEYDRLNKAINQCYGKELDNWSGTNVTLAQYEIAMSRGNMGKASEALEYASSISDDRRQSYILLYNAFKHDIATQHFEDAAVIADSLIRLQSNIFLSVIYNSIEAEQRDYYQQESEKEKLKAKRRLTLLIVTIILFSLFLILLAIIFRLRLKANRMEFEANINNLTSLKESVDCLSEERQNIIESLFKDKWSTLNMLCNEYFELGESEAARKLLIKNIETELNQLRTPQNIKSIESSVNLYLNGISAAMRNELTWLSDNDHTFLTLIVAGFSPRAICLFTDIKYKNYYQKRSRLIKRISMSDAVHKEDFLHRLGAN